MRIDSALGRARPTAARRRTTALLALLLKAGSLSFLCGSALSDTVSLPADAEALLDFPRLPAVALDPKGRNLLLVHEKGLFPIEHLRQPNVMVGGIRIDQRTGGPFAPIAYYGLTLVDTKTGSQSRIETPDDATLGYPQWSPDGSRFLFTVTGRHGVELWIGDPVSKMASRLIETPLNATRGAPCNWMPDSIDVLCRVIVEDRSPLPDGLLDRSEASSRRELRTVSIDRQLVDYFLLSQLEIISTISGERREIGHPRVWDSAEPAPNGQSILVAHRVPARSTSKPADRWEVVTEVWDPSGRVQLTFPSAATRAVHWRATAPASVVWVEDDDGVERILQQAAPFSESPVEIHRTQNRFAGIEWLNESNLAIVSEFDALNRSTNAVLVDAMNGGENARRLWSRNVDVPYPALVTHLSDNGKSVVRVQNHMIYVTGRVGQQSILERIRLDSLNTERVWESDEDGDATAVNVLGPDSDVLLIRHENATEPPNYFLHDLDAGSTRRLTDRTHPAPALSNMIRTVLQYQREDGFELSSTLYAPPGRGEDEKLPLLVWAYPKNYSSGNSLTPPDERGSFPDSEQAFKLFFVSRGYAILDDVSMPIVGDAATANDTFLEQIIANASAAVEAAVDTGTVDPGRIGIAGHSYGAFMAANLLAHTRLFAAGVAMSGAYNRTLTPFGFQTERRTLWQARETYLQMSPLLYSDQIDAPLLLIHGLLDDNAGTQPIHSQQFYDAIRYNGGETELLLLPFEGHSYRSRESVLQVAAETLKWFDTYLGRGTRFASSAGSESVATH